MRQHKEQTIYDIRFALGLIVIGSGIFMFVAGGFPTEHENEIAQYYMYDGGDRLFCDCQN